jgi:hypothetical protein
VQPQFYSFQPGYLNRRGKVTAPRVDPQAIFKGAERQGRDQQMATDVAVDFSGVRLEELDLDSVRVSGGAGRPAPETFKCKSRDRRRFAGIGAISYGGPGCLARAEPAAKIVSQRWALSSTAATR